VFQRLGSWRCILAPDADGWRKILPCGLDTKAWPAGPRTQARPVLSRRHSLGTASIALVLTMLSPFSAVGPGASAVGMRVTSHVGAGVSGEFPVDDLVADADSPVL
jgi:hypothetical protein